MASGVGLEVALHLGDGAGEQGFHGPFGHVEGGGGFSGRAVVEVAEDEDGAFALGEAPEGPLEGALERGIGVQVGGGVPVEERVSSTARSGGGRRPGGC